MGVQPSSGRWTCNSCACGSCAQDQCAQEAISSSTFRAGGSLCRQPDTHLLIGNHTSRLIRRAQASLRQTGASIAAAGLKIGHWLVVAGRRVRAAHTGGAARATALAARWYAPVLHPEAIRTGGYLPRGATHDTRVQYWVIDALGSGRGLARTRAGVLACASKISSALPSSAPSCRVDSKGELAADLHGPAVPAPQRYPVRPTSGYTIAYPRHRDSADHPLY